MLVVAKRESIARDRHLKEFIVDMALIHMRKG